MNSDFSSMAIVKRKCESMMQEKYHATWRNLPLSHNHCVKQAELQDGLEYSNCCEHEYANNCRYSESVPLLYKE